MTNRQRRRRFLRAYKTPRRLIIWKMKKRIKGCKPLFSREQIARAIALFEQAETELMRKYGRLIYCGIREVPELTDRQRAFHSGTEGFKLPMRDSPPSGR